MKKLFLLLAVLLFIGCGKMNVATPYGVIETETDSQIFVYTDADVEIDENGVESDDTTLIVVGVQDNTGANLEKIFKNAMDRIRDIFKTRGEVYQGWVKR